MKVVIHQPYFLPWLGYFSRLTFSDVFLVLDNVQFRKRHYYDRTRIIDMHGSIAWLSLPVGEKFGSRCTEMVLHDAQAATRISRTISFSYRKARHFDDQFESIDKLINAAILSGKNLVEIDIALIRSVFSLLNLPAPPIRFASEFPEEADATDRILSLCERLGAKEIILGAGSSIHIHNLARLREAKLKILVQDYLTFHPTYPQTRRKHLPFSDGLSIIDSIFNAGIESTANFLTEEKYRPAIFSS